MRSAFLGTLQEPRASPDPRGSAPGTLFHAGGGAEGAPAQLRPGAFGDIPWCGPTPPGVSWTEATRHPPGIHPPTPRRLQPRPLEATTAAAFLANLNLHCGEAFPGAPAIEPPGDEMLDGDEFLAVHMRECSDEEMLHPAADGSIRG